MEKGETVVDGEPTPQDILRLLGVEPLASYLTKEIQDVYRLQGVKINDKHIEVIIRQMLRKVEIIDQGDSRFLHGEQAERQRVIEDNAKLEGQWRDPGDIRSVLLGITKASLATESFISAAFVPGDHPRADRGGRSRDPRRPARPEGERDRRASDPGGHGPWRITRSGARTPRASPISRWTRCPARRRRGPISPRQRRPAARTPRRRVERGRAPTSATALSGAVPDHEMRRHGRASCSAQDGRDRIGRRGRSRIARASPRACFALTPRSAPAILSRSRRRVHSACLRFSSTASGPNHRTRD